MGAPYLFVMGLITMENAEDNYFYCYHVNLSEVRSNFKISKEHFTKPIDCGVISKSDIYDFVVIMVFLLNIHVTYKSYQVLFYFN